jgi:hypothetical protein
MLLHPLLNDAVHLIDAIRQSGWAGLQDVGGFDLEHLMVQHSRHVLPTGALGHFFGAEFFAAPRAQDDVGLFGHDA